MSSAVSWLRVPEVSPRTVWQFGRVSPCFAHCFAQSLLIASLSPSLPRGCEKRSPHLISPLPLPPSPFPFPLSPFPFPAPFSFSVASRPTERGLSTSTPFLHAQPRQKHELRQISATRSSGYAPRTPEWLHDLLGCALPEARASQERGTIADDDDDDGDTITGTSTSSISKHTQQQQHRTSLRTKASASARSNKNTSGGGGGRHRYVEQ